MGIFRTVSEINGDISVENANSPYLLFLAPPLTEFRLEFCKGGSAKKN